MKRRLKTPLQDRSRRTLERIVNTAEQMLEDGTFADATVHHIVQRARSSIGSFYARFSDKQVLLDHLVARVHDAMLDRVAQLVRDPKARQLGLEDRVSAYVRVAGDWTRAHRGVLRARLIHHIVLGEKVPRDQVEKSRLLVERVRAYFAPVLPAITAPDPAQALDHALQLIDTLIGARYLLTGPGLDSFPAHAESTFRRNVVRAALCLLDGP